MSFSTTEFCKFCNVGREALRLYEKLGLISPRINPDNQYRIYDEWDASKIAEIKHYQGLGFSLKEIAEILENSDLAQTIESMKKSVTIYQNRIRHDQMRCKKIEEELKIISQIPDLLDCYFYCDLPEMVYFPTPENNQDLNHPGKNNFMQHLDFLTPCLRIDRDYSGDESRQDYSGWGVLITREYAEYLDIHDGLSLPSSKSLCTIIDAGEKGTLSRNRFESFLSRLDQEPSSAVTTMYGALLTRTHDMNGNYHRYLFTFARV